jgi:hypothetical protein
MEDELLSSSSPSTAFCTPKRTLNLKTNCGIMMQAKRAMAFSHRLPADTIRE